MRARIKICLGFVFFQDSHPQSRCRSCRDNDPIACPTLETEETPGDVLHQYRDLLQGKRGGGQAVAPA